MTTAEITLDQVLALARRLRPIDQARLIVRLAPTMEYLLAEPQPSTNMARPPLRGLLADLGAAPSDADITETQRDMWATFPSDAV
ncbi:MAG TPA: hypothetical protein VFZ66_05555 [Herpetosiphonaceae bacterium]